jgi:hypothetical protein
VCESSRVAIAVRIPECRPEEDRLVSAASAAAAHALRSPYTAHGTGGDRGPQVIVEKKPYARALQIKTRVVPISFGVLDDRIICDPTAEEVALCAVAPRRASRAHWPQIQEQLLSASCTVLFDQNKELKGVIKPGVIARARFCDMRAHARGAGGQPMNDKQIAACISAAKVGSRTSVPAVLMLGAVGRAASVPQGAGWRPMIVIVGFSDEWC